MKQYEKYKASGVEWLGDIPEHWKPIYLKHMFSTIVGGVWGNDPTADSDTYCIRVADFDYDRLSLSDRNLTLREFSDSELNNRLLKKGDLVLEKSGGGEKTPVGRTVLFDLNVPAVCSNFTNRLEPKADYLSDYIKYLFANMYAKKVTLSHVKQTTGIQNLSTESFFGEKTFIPSLAEQGAIARYLDYVVGRVDEVIGQRGELIERLQAKRKALINEVVTCGLDPTAPTRPSGIDWLGNIPAHWKIGKLKHFSSKIGSGVTPTGGAEVYQLEGVLFIRSQNVYSDGLRIDEVAYISDDIDAAMSNSRVVDNDVLLNITGASIGRCCYVKNIGRANVNQHVCIIRPVDESLMCEYLQLVLNSDIGQIQIALAQNGGNREGLNFENIKNFIIPDISLTEQKEIVTFIKERTTKIDNLVGELQGQIERLRQYKTTIISEAVTGKIDLREWQQPTNN